jgi:rhodanese-related sulfurtransferase
MPFLKKNNNKYIDIEPKDIFQRIMRIEKSENPPLLLDVRTQSEYDRAHLKNSILISHNNKSEIDKFTEENKEKEIIIYCSIGYRSRKVAEYAAEKGHPYIKNVVGGIWDWIDKEYPVEYDKI